MKYDNNSLEQARNADIINFLENYARLSFTNKGGEYRCIQHPSLSIKTDRLTWFWHSKDVGGRGALDFLVKVEGMGFCDAMEAVTGLPTSIAQSKHIEQPKTLILPEKAGFLYKRLFAYLSKTRGIDSNIIVSLLHEKKLYEDKKGNVVFVGFDETNTPKFACLRGTYTNNSFRMDCAGSDKRYSFNTFSANSNALHIFESPIDLMSYASLENTRKNDISAWQELNLLSLAGTADTALQKYLETHTQINELIFCLDNDPAGQEATATMVQKYNKKGYLTKVEIPKGKDFNEDLINTPKNIHSKNERGI